MTVTGLRPFQMTCLLGLVLTVPAFSLILGRYYERNVPVLAESLLKNLKPELYDLNVGRSEAASRKQVWAAYTYWGKRSTVPGVSLRLFENPDLFESLFPGYSASFKDPEAWRTYLTSDGSLGFWSPELRIDSPEGALLAPVPWDGGLPIFEKVGADVVVIGSSRVFMSVVPKVLAEGLSGTAIKSPKILVLGQYLVDSISLMRAAERMKASGRRAKLLILGYPRDQALEGKAMTRELVPGKGPMQRLAKYARARIRGATLKLNWRRLVSCVFCGMVRQDYGRGLGIREAELIFPKAYAGDLPTLVDFSRIALQTPASHVDSDACDQSDGRAVLEKLLSMFREVADNIILYVVPETPLSYMGLSPCFLSESQRMIRDLGRTGARIVDDGWDAYGLDYRDFVHASADDPGEVRLDFGHTNYFGAAKVSRRLAAVASRLLEK